MFWLRSMKNNFQLHTIIWRPARRFMLYFSDLNTLKMRSCVPLCRVGRFLHRPHLLQAGQWQRSVSTLSPLGSAFNAKPSPRINFNPIRKNVVSITAKPENNNQSVKVSNYFDFIVAMVTKKGHQNRLKIGNCSFWSKIERFHREINIEHNQISKRYFNRR